MNKDRNYIAERLTALQNGQIDFNQALGELEGYVLTERAELTKIFIESCGLDGNAVEEAKNDSKYAYDILVGILAKL